MEEISEGLDILTDEQVRWRLRDYERSNQNRNTLISRCPYPPSAWKGSSPKFGGTDFLNYSSLYWGYHGV